MEHRLARMGEALVELLDCELMRDDDRLIAARNAVRAALGR
jgi:hypothetical protein